MTKRLNADIDDGVYVAFQRIAKVKREPMTVIVRRLVNNYVAREERKMEVRDDRSR